MGDAPIVALFGATALGKSDVADALARAVGAEIVVADSMQVYRGLPILTNQPEAHCPDAVRRHLVGYVSPQREFTVAEYASDAHAALDALRAAERPVIVEGGSGLYLRAALGDLAFAGPADAGARRALEMRWRDDREGMIRELNAIDPGTAERIDTANPRRVIRALEAVRGLGRPLAVAERDRLWRPAERYPHRLFALDPGARREALRARIDTRVQEMLAAGALDEVARVRAAGPLSRTALQAIGVRELGAVLDGELDLREAAARMAARTHALARRQLAWMRKLPNVSLLPVEGRAADSVATVIRERLRESPW